jgi:hypothetical protein
MGHIDAPTGDICVHTQKVATPTVIGGPVVNKDLGLHHVDVAMLPRIVCGLEGGAKWHIGKTHRQLTVVGRGLPRMTEWHVTKIQ